MRSCAPLLTALTSAATSFPPTKRCVEQFGSDWLNGLATSKIWRLSSRVGEMTMAPT